MTAGAVLATPAGVAADRPRGLGGWSLFPIALAAFGGPLALGALYAPASVADVSGSAGTVVLVGIAAFIAPLAVWLRFGRDVAGPGGLTAFVAAAAGRRAAVVHAAVWTSSYLLYLLYTSAYVVYDLLPPAWPGVHRWRPLLAALLPTVVAAAVLAGRRVAFGLIALLGAGQVALLGLLDVVAVGHAPAAPAFASTATAATGHAAGGVATLFVCGSLPLFLGGEVRAPRRTFRRVLPAAFAVTAAGVLLAVYPLASDPAFAHAAAPGASLARADAGAAVGTAVAAGVAASVVGVMLLEYVALTRLLHAVAGRSPTSWTRVLAVPLVLVGPVSLLIDPDRFYDALLRPSLALLWLAQLGVVVVFPRYLALRGRLRSWHVAAAAVAMLVTGYGFVTAVTGAGST